MDPAEGVYGPGDSFLVDVKLDIDKECINTVEAVIEFPRAVIQAEDFLSGESLLSVWVDKPATDDIAKINTLGRLHFSGGIPGGYCGRIPGDPGESNIIGRIIFYVPNFIVGDVKNSAVNIDFINDNTRVFINDGFGTEEELITKGIKITIAEHSVLTGDAWEEQIKKDKIRPEPFVIEINSRPDIFAGQHYIIFNTSDKQSGVDHYKVLEIRPSEEIGVEPKSGFWEKLLGKERPAPEWKRGEIPYLLSDQELLSIIKVKAVDKAGNERLSEYIPPLPKQPEKRILLGDNALACAIMIIGLLCIIGAIIFIIKIKKISNSKSNNYEEDNKKEFE